MSDPVYVPNRAANADPSAPTLKVAPYVLIHAAYTRNRDTTISQAGTLVRR